MKEFVLTTRRETHLQTVEWFPENASTKTIFLVHSYGDTAFRYDWLARFFNKSGWNVISFDLASHGKSGGLRAKWRSLDDLMNDLELVVHHYKKQEITPHTWVGFGMGFGATLLSLYEIRTLMSVFTAYIFWAPIIRLSTRFPKVLLDSIKYVNSFTSHLNVLTLQANVLTSNTEALYTAIPDWDDDYGKVSAQTAAILIESGKLMMKNWPKMVKPVWVGWGEDDEFVDASWFKTQQTGQMETTRRYQEFDDATHYLEQDYKGLEIAQEVEKWLKTLKK